MVTTIKAASILERVEKKKAGKVMDRVVGQDVAKMDALVLEMDRSILTDSIVEMEVENFDKISLDIRLNVFETTPTEQLIIEVPPTVDPDSSDPVPTQVREDLASYRVLGAPEKKWVKGVGSPAPIDAILVKFNTAQSDFQVDVESLVAVPSGAPSLPVGHQLNSIFSVDIGGTTADAEVTAHVTVYVEKVWLEANDVHKWAVQFQRLDESTNAWVGFQTKRVREDEERVYYSISVPGFSTVAITATEEIPTRQFDVSGLSISPSLPDEGEEVTISADVTNIGDKDQTITVTLYIDGATEGVGSIELVQGGTDVLEFTTTLAAGVREIRIDRQIQSVTVANVLPTPTPAPQVATPTPEPTATAVPATPTPTAVPATPVPTATILPAEPTATPTPEADEDGSSALLISLIVVIVLAVIGGGGGGGYYFLKVQGREIDINGLLNRLRPKPGAGA